MKYLLSQYCKLGFEDYADADCSDFLTINIGKYFYNNLRYVI